MYNADVHIGSVIDSLIKQRGMSYAEFARKLNCDRTTVYNLVRSKSIDIDRLIRICNIFNIDIISHYYLNKEDNEVLCSFAVPTDNIKNLTGEDKIEVRIMINRSGKLEAVMK